MRADEDDARIRIESFVFAWSDAPIPEFRAVLKILAEWRPEILGFHRCNRVTTGRLEARTTSSACSSASPTAS